MIVLFDANFAKLAVNCSGWLDDGTFSAKPIISKNGFLPGFG
jgi:hypothetical protein